MIAVVSGNLGGMWTRLKDVLDVLDELRPKRSRTLIDDVVGAQILEARVGR